MKKVFGVLAIILACISLFICWWLSAVAFVLGVVGICCGSSDESSTAPLIGLLLGLMAFIINVVVLSSLGIIL